MHDIGKTNFNVPCSRSNRGTVVIIIDRDYTHLQKRKDLFQIIADHDIIPPPSGEILNHDAIDFILLHHLQELLHSGAVKAGPRITIIYKFQYLCATQIRMLLDIIIQ